MQVLRFFPAPLAFALLFAAGCGRIGTGGHAIYRIAETEQIQGADCDVGNDPNSTTLRTGDTFIVYAPASEESTFFLDLGLEVLAGEETDEGYAFAGDTVSVQEIGGGTRITLTIHTDVSISYDGASVSGDISRINTTTCEGTCPGFDDASCSSHSSFVGVELEDAVIGI